MNFFWEFSIFHFCRPLVDIYWHLLKVSEIQKLSKVTDFQKLAINKFQVLQNQSKIISIHYLIKTFTSICNKRLYNFIKQCTKIFFHTYDDGNNQGLYMTSTSSYKMWEEKQKEPPGYALSFKGVFERYSLLHDLPIYSQALYRLT